MLCYTCPHCGANLDPWEKCDCPQSRGQQVPEGASDLPEEETKMPTKIRKEIDTVIDDIIAADPLNCQLLCELLYVLRRNEHSVLKSVMFMARGMESAIVRRTKR